MESDNMQKFKNEFVQQLKEISPRLSEIIQKHGLAEKLELQIKISPNKKLKKVSCNEDFRIIDEKIDAFYCILNTVTNQFDCFQ